MLRSGTILATTALATLLATAAAPALAASHSGGDETGMTQQDSDAMTGAAAEQGATGPAPSDQEGDDAATVEYTEAELDAFATAAVEVSEVRKDYAERISQSEDREAAEALVAEAQSKMVEAVQSTDAISVEAYAEIGAAAQNDPALAHRLTLLIQEKTNAPQTDQPVPQTDG